MNIKWAYCLIAVLYLILIVLRGINHISRKAYDKEHKEVIKAFCIKKDFFTTVAAICILVTLGINMAAMIGGKYLNGSSILVTVLVTGFTAINSCNYIRFTQDGEDLFLLGYVLKSGDVKEISCKERNGRNILKITFTKDIESYNYARLIVYGKNKDLVTKAFEKLQIAENEKDEKK